MALRRVQWESNQKSTESGGGAAIAEKTAKNDH